MMPKSQRILCLSMLLMASLALAACSGESTTSGSAAKSSETTSTNSTAGTPAANTTATTGTAATATPPTGKKLSIAVIPKGTAHPYWKTVHAGAKKAADELGVTMDWIGPASEDDRSQQIDVVNTFIAKGVDAIVLAPLDDTALATPVETATGRGIKVVIIDSALKSEAQSSFIATNNREGGHQAADMLAAAMGGQGKVMMMRYNQGSASTADREEGFLEEMKSKYPQIEIVSDNQYGGVTQQSAMDNGITLLNKFGSQIQGIFCPNESSASGMLRALENTGLAGKVHYVGFDASETLIDGMKKKEIDGLVAQDPFNMGYLGVKTAVQAARGETVEKKIDTALVKVTPENINTPEIQGKIAPELAGM